MLIELFPPATAGGTWGARVSGRGGRRKQSGFVIGGDAYSWAMHTLLEMKNESEVQA